LQEEQLNNNLKVSCNFSIISFETKGRKAKNSKQQPHKIRGKHFRFNAHKI